MESFCSYIRLQKITYCSLVDSNGCFILFFAFEGDLALLSYVKPLGSWEGKKLQQQTLLQLLQDFSASAPGNNFCPQRNIILLAFLSA